MRELERETPRDTPTSATADAAHEPILLIGRGRLGGALARAAEAAGIGAALIGREADPSTYADAEVALLCVADAEIANAAATLAGRAPRLRFAGHTSGACGLGPLEPLAEAGAALFSLHPLQTVPDPESSIAGAPAAIDGSSREALETARRLGSALGMRPFEVPESSRAAYHAAASIASNFLVTLEQGAVELLERAGFEDARELLAPLVLRTAANWSERGADALTGPIARGDTATIESHLRALREVRPELIPAYEALAERTEAIARAGKQD
jgi:predicted short-subunit dehydrogenase-like oxidoreductase (DUF2520 family)